MSLLNFLFKDRQEKRPAPEAEHIEAEAPIFEDGPVPNDLPPELNGEADLFEDDDVEDDDFDYAEDAPTLAAIPMPVGAIANGGDAAGNGKLTLDEIRLALSRIAEIITDEDPDEVQESEAGDFSALTMTIAQVAQLQPKVFRSPEKVAGNTTEVTVMVKDLYQQLGSGKVTTTTGKLLHEVLEDFLNPDFDRYRADDVSLPLNLAVTAVQPDELKKRTTSQERDDGADSIPNLFSAPGQTSGVPTSKGLDIGQNLGPPPAPQPAAPTPVPEPVQELEPTDVSNTGFSKVSDDGVFGRDVDPYSRVSGAGDGGIANEFDPDRLSFLDDEDQVAPEAQAPAPDPAPSFQIDEDAPLFKFSDDPPDPSVPEAVELPTLPELSEEEIAAAMEPGFEGCIFTHEEGYVMAAHWKNEQADVLGAIAPQIFKKVEPYAEQLGLGDLNPVTLFVEDYAVTVVECGDVFLAVITSLKQFNKRQIRLAQLAGAELEHRMERAKAIF